MSTIKTKNVQIGDSTTAPDNYRIYQTSSADGTLRVATGNATDPEGSADVLIINGTSGVLNFKGNVSATDITASSITISSSPNSSDHAVRADRSIIAGNGLTGGGNLLNDVTLSISQDGVGTSEIENNAITTDKINNNAVTSSKIATGFGLIPSGGIIMWSGAVNNIPIGWYLCDGNNNTPDLRNRFIVGAGDSYAVDGTGGSDTVSLTEANLPAHTHGDGTLSAASAGNHSHTITVSSKSLSGYFDWPRGDANSRPQNTTVSGIVSKNTTTTNEMYGRFNRSNFTAISRININATHDHTASSNTTGAHTHDVTGSTASTGSGTVHENRPPYYALAFIMKA